MLNEKKKNIEYSYDAILKNIFVLPQSLKECIDSYFSPNHREMFQKIRELLKKLKISRILFVGNTSNYFASFIAHYCLTTASKLHYNFTWESFEISEFYDYILPNKHDDGTLYIFISKSGRSRLLTRILEHLRLLKFNSKLIWLVTNSIDSENAKHCGYIFPIYAKPEAVHATISFQNTIFVLYLISQLLLNRNPLTNDNQEIFEKIIREMRKYQENFQIMKRRIFDFLGYDFKFLYFISKGVSRSSAFNSALLANSLYRIFAEGILLGHFFLGTFKIVNSNIRCILLVNESLRDSSKKFIHNQIKLITDQIGVLLLISNNKSLISALRYNKRVFAVHFECEINALTPIIESYILQIILLEFSKNTGFFKK